MAAVVGPTPYSADNVTAPGMDGFAIAPSQSTNHPIIARAIYVGVAGHITLITPAGNLLEFLNCLAGSIIPVCSIRVNNTSTTATNLIGII